VEDLLIINLDGETGLRLSGELDTLSASKLVEALAKFQGPGPIRVDLSELTFIDSSGLHAIASAASAVNGAGPVILEGASPMVLRVFEITNLARHPNLEIR
jgi:anti-anti-sigma factor